MHVENYINEIYDRKNISHVRYKKKKQPNQTKQKKNKEKLKNHKIINAKLHTNVQ